MAHYNYNGCLDVVRNNKLFYIRSKLMEDKYTEVEEALISVISNFMLWYTTEENEKIAEEYLSNEHIDYNDVFTIKKEKVNEKV